MLRVDAGAAGRYCDGANRRHFLQFGLTGLASLGLPQILQAKAAAAQHSGGAKDTSMILLWLDGGPGHMDMYDLKPDAPSQYRGIWRPIPTNVPGIDVTELFPLQAKVADKFSIIRSLHHDTGDHFTGAHWMLTGRGAGVTGLNNAGKYPFFGSIATKQSGARQPGMPPYVAVPYGMSVGLVPGYFGGNYLGVHHDPFATQGDAAAENFKVPNLYPPGNLSVDRLQDRHAMLNHFDHLRRAVDTSRTMESMDKFNQQAFELVTGSRARAAFDISSEKPETRDKYGRNNFGQSVLLARRLVEAGTTVVSVLFAGWDHHWDLQKGMENYLPRVDQAVAALLEDLSERGQLERTLVVMCGEFSRTPRMNDGGNGGAPMSMGTPGRDHWGNSMFCFVAGGGLRGGQIVGSTNRLGEAPKDRPLRVGDLHHTIFHVLGIDPGANYLDTAGRPIPAIDHGAVIEELI